MRFVYLEAETDAIAQVNSFERTVVRTGSSDPSGRAHQQRSTSQCNNASICELLAFDQTNSPKLRQLRQLRHTGICKPPTASEVDISDPVACLNQVDHSRIGDVGAMAQVNVVQILR